MHALLQRIALRLGVTADRPSGMLVDHRVIDLHERILRRSRGEGLRDLATGSPLLNAVDEFRGASMQDAEAE